MRPPPPTWLQRKRVHRHERQARGHRALEAEQTALSPLEGQEKKHHTHRAVQVILEGNDYHMHHRLSEFGRAEEGAPC